MCAKWKIPLFLIFAFLAACAQSRKADYYFPETEISNLENESIIEPVYFVEFLSRANEPSLFADRSLKAAFRITILTSFFGAVIVDILEMDDGSITGRYARFKEDDRISDRGTFIIESADLENLNADVTSEDFWSSNSKQDVLVSDGDFWLLEIKRGQKYHAAINWGPTNSAVFRLGKKILDISGVSYPNS